MSTLIVKQNMFAQPQMIAINANVLRCTCGGNFAAWKTHPHVIDSLGDEVLGPCPNANVERMGTISFWHRSFARRLLWEVNHLAPFLKLMPMNIWMATVFTDAGKAIVTNRLKGSGTEPSYGAWGTGAGTAGVTDTTLFTEAAEARVAATTSRVTTTVTNDTYQAVYTLTSASGQTITNSGLFDASTVGNLFFKGDFTGVVLNTNDAIQFTDKTKFT